MKSVSINLNLAEHVKKFVSIAEKYNFEIDIRSGRHVVNAKSMLGIFSLDLSEDVIIEIFSDECDAFIEDIKEFIV
ncbi:MAG: HPr family phosphocarrier protein [Clostridia bacterium]|nr:HPr family phosphocarrier protein [Clostridia bacterium]